MEFRMLSFLVVYTPMTVEDGTSPKYTTGTERPKDDSNPFIYAHYLMLRGEHWLLKHVVIGSGKCTSYANRVE